MRLALAVASIALAVTALVATGATDVPLHAAPSRPQENKQDVPVFGAETSLVLVDVVVRDKKNRLVRDLRLSDFEVYENRNKQTISDFRVVDLGTELSSASAPSEAPHQSSAAPGPPVAPSQPAPHVTDAAAQTGPAVIAFVFDRLLPESRSAANRAVLAYLDQGHRSGDIVGVFAIGDVLRVLQSFTSDTEAVRAAFDRAGRLAQARDVGLREQARALEAKSQPAETGAEAAGLLAVQRDFDRMQGSMLNMFSQLERDVEGRAQINALLAVVSGLKALHGRKTIVFFSEGLQLTPDVENDFLSVIANANRANVTVYAIDALGLRIHSVTEGTTGAVLAYAQSRLDQEARGGVGGTDGPMTVGLEGAENALRYGNPHSGLGQLAEETGGFLVANTNDLGQGFERMQEEMRFYYLLSYSPTNAAFDGSYRSIRVKVNRPGVSVRTRKGYLAVRPEVSVPVRIYEVPVLTALERVPRPKQFPLRATALSFPEAKRLGRVPVMVELPASALTFAFDKKKKVYTADFSIVARLRDRQGREVDRLSRHYPLTVPADQLEATKRGDVLFFQETDLAAGRYTLEAAAYDSLGHTASVATAQVEVGAANGEGLRLSSLVLLRKIEKVSAAEQGRDHPLHYGETIVYPNMGKPYSKSAVPAIGFFFTVYSDGPEAAAPTQASIEILKDGQTVASTATALGTPDNSGRIQQVGALALDRLSSGDYTLKLTVASGAKAVHGQSEFVVEP